MKAFFFVPANNERFLHKASADIVPENVIFDLEDSIAESQIDQSIDNIAVFCEKFSRSNKYIRIDSRYSKYCIDRTSALDISGYVVPKVENNEIVNYIFSRKKELRTILLIETLKGLRDIENILKFSENVQGLAFGGEDYCLETGCSRTPSNLLFARMRIIETARLHELEAYDTIYPFINDTAGFNDELSDNFEMGFDGKMVIHPLQLDLFKEFDSRKSAELNDIINRYEENVKNGKTVLVHKGRIYERNHISKLKKLVC